MSSIILAAITPIQLFLHDLVRVPDIALRLVPFKSDGGVQNSRSKHTKHLLNLSTFDMHIWFAECERIDVGIRVEVGQAVIDKTVGCFIGSHRVNNVEEFGILWKAPVINSNLRSRHIGPTDVIEKSPEFMRRGTTKAYHSGIRSASKSPIQRVLMINE